MGSEKKVTAWYMDDSDKDQREEHKCNPDRPITGEELEKRTGVLYKYIPLLAKEGEPYQEHLDMAAIRKERGYSYEDEIRIHPDTLPNYEQKLKIFFEEHLHTDEEIRYCLEGSGYFDVRDNEDHWIRILMNPGDLIVLPAGIYHRFTLDTNNYIKAKRFFVGEPVWTPHNRPAEEQPARREYIKFMNQQAQCVKA